MMEAKMVPVVSETFISDSPKGSDTSSFSKAIGDYTFFLMDGQCLTTDKIMTTVHGLSMVNRAFGQ